ncbi:peroxidase 27 isoform X2 [Gossypium raimondii]|uniref:peroxidase 27 isoform X2 n=1 Tax=Gossypium raimondii TaxID=29730 RepID=UPI00227A2904|nr:peroxidase 27 isoform X2 [Gossypium raimondii]
MEIGQRVLLCLHIQLIIVVMVLNHSNAQGLKLGFYSETCPNAESIIRKTTYGFISRAPTLAAPLLRLHFHDCFVRGCDGSVLLNSTKNQAEKDAIPNLSLRGYHVIDAVKSAVEQACPGVVSCADILALAARDSVSMINGPSWKVPLGRRDGRISKLRGHTIGTSHCVAFGLRLYNFSGKGDADPSMDPTYVTQLKQKCKPGDITSLVEMDPGSFKTFDEAYYTLVSKRRGLFGSDAALLNNAETKAYVLQASRHGSTFAKDFAVSMEKMGKVEVLTGNQGEIRKHCAMVN